jgi:hypothetical protein
MVSMSRVWHSESSRNRLFDRLASQLPGCVTEHVPGLLVRQDDTATGIHHDDSIRHGLQQVTEFRFG